MWAGSRGQHLTLLSAGWMRWRASKSRPSRTDDDLAVDDASGQERPQRIRHLGEVARERTVVAATQLDLVAVAEDQAPEPVPLRFEEEVAGPGRSGRLRQHGPERRHHGELHITPARRARRCVVSEEPVEEAIRVVVDRPGRGWLAEAVGRPHRPGTPPAGRSSRRR